SLFGVGAPEALVIGVVSLLVFGPKGLADIAKQLGATLREFQPTIRELQDVSREFQDTLRDEIEKPLE
ncbi:Tat family transporter: protein export (chloroplast membrane protein HCF106C), partial [Ostreococcus lucimarinus CCE9901]